MRIHQKLQIDRWRAKGHPFPWVQPSLMKMVLPLIAVTCTPHSARLNPYWNLYTWGLTTFIPLWGWSSAQTFPLTSNTGFTRIGATVLCCLALVLLGPTLCVGPGSSARRWVLGAFTVFICLVQLQMSPQSKAGGYVCGWMSQNHLIEGEKAVHWFSFALYRHLHTHRSVWVYFTPIQSAENHSRRYWRIPAWGPLVSSDCK